MANTFILADETVLDRGFRLLMSGCKLERFKANPIMLWMHKRDNNWKEFEILPIGTWENIRIEDNKLKADATFDETDPLALAVKAKVEKGILRGASPGVNVMDYSEDPEKMVKGQTRPTVTKWEIMEASIVDIPSNRNALKLYSSFGEDEIKLPKIDKKMATEEKKEGKVEQPVDQLPKDRSSLMAWISDIFGIKPKEEDPKPKESEKKEENLSTIAQPPAEAETKKADLAAKDKEIADLKSQIKNLEEAPGAKSEELNAETDNNTPTEDELDGLSAEDVEMYKFIKSR